MKKKARSKSSTRIKISLKPSEPKYKHKSHKTTCFGEFCEYIIPPTFKNLKTNPKISDASHLYNIPEENKYTSKTQERILPFFLPVFTIKKVYDNPQLVNIVLKAFSIFPKTFDKEEEIAKILSHRRRQEEQLKMKLTNRAQQKHHNNNDNDNDDSESNSRNESKQIISRETTVTVYTPTPYKFNHINYDEMYIEKHVCENCFKIYSLINEFLKHVGKNATQFESFNKVKELLLRGDNLKLNIYEDGNNLNFEDNLLFQEEIHEISLKKLLKKNILKTKLKESQQQLHKEKYKIKRRNTTTKDNMEKVFSYNIKINPKLLKLNLLAEKTQNKFFKLIFNELRTEPETLHQKLGIKKIENTKPVSMPLLRMHMGINSHIYKPKFFGKENNVLTESNTDLHDSKSVNMKEEQMNIQRENNQIDMNIFLLYKSLKREEQGIRVNRIAKTIKACSDIDFINSERKPSSNNNNNNVPHKDESLSNKDSSESSSNCNNEVNNDNNKLILNYNSAIKKTKTKCKSIRKKINFRLSNPTISTVYSLNNNKCKTSRGNTNAFMHLVQDWHFDVTKLSTQNHHSHSVGNLKLNLNINDNDEFKETYIKSKKTKTTKVKPKLSQMFVKAHYKLSSHKLPYYQERKSVSFEKPKSMSIDNYVQLHESKVKVKMNKQRKLEEFIKITPNQITDDQKNKNSDSSSEEDNRMSSSRDMKYLSNIKKEKKIQITSLYYDKNTNNNTTPYYYITTPLPKFNEGNIPITENPLLLTQHISSEQYNKLGKFQRSPFIQKSNIYVYDSSTAIPYEIMTFSPNQQNDNNVNSNMKFIFIIINDFFDSYAKYRNTMYSVFNSYKNSFYKFKCVLFNLPGQSATMFNKNVIFNNIYYSLFIDRFLYFLYSKNEFDQTYNVVFIGFGNGAQIALTYASQYELYWSNLYSIIMFNGYCENDSFIDQSMFELLKTIKKTKNPKVVDFFIKSITIEPHVFMNNNNNINNTKNIFHHRLMSDNSLSSSSSFYSKSSFHSRNNIYNNLILKAPTTNSFIQDDNSNPMTLTGYHNITKGYFFNTKINHRNITTPLISVHSNQNSFISINNINALFMNKIRSYSITLPKTLGRNNTNKMLLRKHKELSISTNHMPTVSSETMFTKANTKSNWLITTDNKLYTQQSKEDKNCCEYNFNELLDKNGNNKLKRKLIIIEGSHDIINKDAIYVKNVLSSYIEFIINNQKDIVKNQS